VPRIAWLEPAPGCTGSNTLSKAGAWPGVSLKVSRLSATLWSRATPSAPRGGGLRSSFLLRLRR